MLWNKLATKRKNTLLHGRGFVQLLLSSVHAKHESIYAILSINTGQLNLDREKQIKLVFLELDDKRFERKTWCIL